MCLMTLLKYSPRTLKRIRNLIRGRDAILVTRVPHRDDVYIADMLDVPVLSADPDTAYLYASKSGGKRVFASAGVGVPPGEYDVYSMPQVGGGGAWGTGRGERGAGRGAVCFWIHLTVYSHAAKSALCSGTFLYLPVHLAS